MTEVKAAIIGFLAGGFVASAMFMVMRRGEQDKKTKAARKHVFIKDEAGRSFEEYVPPLPTQLIALLASARLCDLSCQDGDDPPHTSLMNFSFIEDEQDIIVMTTRRDTKKYVLMEQHPNVSMLLHDFPATALQRQTSNEQYQRTMSVSLQGHARLETGARAEKYRKLHLQRNLEYKQFIEGEDKAVITIKIKKARMCNVQDKVSVWEAVG